MAGGPLGGILCQYCVVWWQAGVYSLSVPCAGGQVYGQHGGAQGSVCHGGAQGSVRLPPPLLCCLGLIQLLHVLDIKQLWPLSQTSS